MVCHNAQKYTLHLYTICLQITLSLINDKNIDEKSIR